MRHPLIAVDVSPSRPLAALSLCKYCTHTPHPFLSAPFIASSTSATAASLLTCGLGDAASNLTSCIDPGEEYVIIQQHQEQQQSGQQQQQQLLSSCHDLLARVGDLRGCEAGGGGNNGHGHHHHAGITHFSSTKTKKMMYSLAGVSCCFIFLSRSYGICVYQLLSRNPFGTVLPCIVVMPRVSPVRNISESEDFDREEIATYEEVARLFPRAGVFRPVVFVGPPGVGRNEIKRRIVAMEPDRFRTTIPRKRGGRAKEKTGQTSFDFLIISDTSRPSRPGEIHGKDYFFDSRQDMRLFFIRLLRRV